MMTFQAAAEVEGAYEPVPCPQPCSEVNIPQSAEPALISTMTFRAVAKVRSPHEHVLSAPPTCEVTEPHTRMVLESQVNGINDLGVFRSSSSGAAQRRSPLIRHQTSRSS